MCGISGIFEYQQQNTVNHAELHAINSAMQSRGPDGDGLWISNDGFIGLAHRRLSIIDLSSNANQPMHDDFLSIVFNGEIYNYQSLRNDLIQKGVIFKTNSDTEVILKLYQYHGEKMLSQLRGMFAFAIWDDKNKTLFCARDHFGIKPFYYADNENCFRFASQVKALLKVSKTAINTNKNAAGQIGFYLLGSVPEPYTLYEGIRSLPAGHYLKITRNEKPILKSFYSVRDAIIKAENATTTNETLADALYDTVKHHLVADVDVGVFLSAGIDSSVLISIAAELASKQVNTMTLGFEEYKNTEKDETLLAEQISQHYKTHHQTQWISEAAAKTQFESIMHAMDQPSIDGINTYFVSMLAHQSNMKVALSGLGADEIFAGYSHFKRIPRLLHITKPLSIIPAFSKTFRSLASKALTAKQASIFEYGRDISSAYFLSRALYLPYELTAFLDPQFVKKGLAELNLFERLKNNCAGIHSPRFQISALELQWYMRNQLLRDSDWASMAHSLEIRVPFVDVTFFETMLSLITKQQCNKKELAFVPHNALPDAVINRKKTGFNIPVTKWFSSSANMKTFSKNIMQCFL